MAFLKASTLAIFAIAFFIDNSNALSCWYCTNNENCVTKNTASWPEDKIDDARCQFVIADGTTIISQSLASKDNCDQQTAINLKKNHDNIKVACCGLTDNSQIPNNNCNVDWSSATAYVKDVIACDWDKDCGGETTGSNSGGEGNGAQTGGSSSQVNQALQNNSGVSSNFAKLGLVVSATLMVLKLM